MERRDFLKIIGGVSTSALIDPTRTLAESREKFLRDRHFTSNDSKGKPFKLIIRSPDYMTALDFSLSLLPTLGSVIKTKLIPAVIYPKQVLLDSKQPISLLIERLGKDGKRVRWQDTEEWSFTNAPDRIRRFADTGINTLILTEEIWDWDHVDGAYFDFERTIEALRMTTIFIESYDAGIEEIAAKLSFWEPRPVISKSMYEVMQFIVDHYEFNHLIFGTSCELLPRIDLNPWNAYGSCSRTEFRKILVPK